jgi:2-polyprenyl-3-methyl-5-hydroxy-6-metoxy-1,4-benzoquinol methylase
MNKESSNTSSLVAAGRGPTSGELIECPLCGSSSVSSFLSAPDRFHLRLVKYRLDRCAGCSVVWLSCPPTPEEMPFHYAADYHNRAISTVGERNAIARWKPHREAILRYKVKGKILDIGCSSGGFLGTLDKRNWELYGIEIESATAEKARSSTGAEVFVGDAVRAPFPPESFDVVTCFDVLEHVYDLREFLKKILEWLKPGGFFNTYLPNIASWEARMFGGYWYGLELPRHLFHFSPQSPHNLMNSLQFEEMQLRTPRTCYVERSVNYLYSAVIERLGASAPPQSNPRPTKLPWRIIRKALRVSLISPFGAIASIAGAGGSLEAVFAKPSKET